MLIFNINRSGYRAEIKNVPTEKGVMAVESLTPDSTRKDRIKAAEDELYSVFSKYKNVPDKS